MNATVRDWLPDAALTPARIAAALVACLGQWSIRWFAGARTVGVCDRAPSVAAQGGGQARLEAGPVHFLLPATGKRHLLEAMLSQALEGKPLTPPDHQLLDGLAARACQDLVDRLAALPAVAAAPGGAVRTMALLVGEEECGRLTIPTAALVSLIKAGLAPSAPARARPLTGRRRAIGDCTAAIDAMLGQVAITVDDLHGLEPGDVLVLDRPIDQPLPLRLLPTGGILGRGKLASSEGRNAILWQA